MQDQLAALWTTWIDLLETNGFVVRPVLEPGAADWEIVALETATGLHLTDEVRVLYRLNIGQRLRPSPGLIREGRAAPWPTRAVPLFGFYELLDTREAANAWQGWKDIADDQGLDGMAEFAEHVTVSEPDKVKKEYWIPGWLPFSRDGGGNSFAFDFDPEPGGTVGQIIIIGLPPRRSPPSPSPPRLPSRPPRPLPRRPRSQPSPARRRRRAASSASG